MWLRMGLFQIGFTETAGDIKSIDQKRLKENDRDGGREGEKEGEKERRMDE